MAVLVAILLAVLVAAAVLLAASVVRVGEGHAGVAAAPRSAAGWTGRKNPDADQRAAAAAAAVEPVDVSLAEFLRETVDEGEAYLQVDDLAADPAARQATRPPASCPGIATADVAVLTRSTSRADAPTRVVSPPPDRLSR